MQLQIATNKFQDMVSKSIHCVSNNKLIPMTSLIGISVHDKKLTLTTTDFTNFFYVSLDEEVDCEDFEISVLADTFVKLIQKTTSETITMTQENNVLVIKGNGTYKFELPLDAGKPIRFPKKIVESALKDTGNTINISTVKSVINSNKSSLATDMQYPSLTGYFCGDKVVTSNKKTVCWNNVKLMDRPALLSPIVMDLISVCSGENLNVSTIMIDSAANVVAYVFQNDTEIIYAPEFAPIDTFPIDVMGKLISQMFTSKCVISRKSILDILDRLSLFVSSYDKKSIHMTFTEDGILLSSKKSSCTELVEYVSSENFNPYSCNINIEYLHDQIASQDSDTVELYYGSEVAIKLVTGDIIQIVALLNETEVK